MKKNIYLLIFCLLFLSSINLMAQSVNNEEEEEEMVNDSILIVTKPPVNKIPISQPDNFITINHKGYYIAKYELTYKVNSIEKKIETGMQTIGWKQTFYLPVNATDIQLKGYVSTGLVWAPWPEIYNKLLQLSDLNKCYTNRGTTLNTKWDNNCESL